MTPSHPHPICSIRNTRRRASSRFQERRHGSVFERGNAQRAELSRLARLGDEPLPDRLGPVGSSPQLLSDVLQEACDAIGPLFDRLARHAIRTRRVAAPITGQLLPSVEQRSAIAYDIEQIREPLVGVCGTPPIQLALHVENEPGIHRVGHVVHLLLAKCTHCPPSPCGRLSRPRTTTQAPPPLRAIASRFGQPIPRGSATRAGSQVPPMLLVRCRSRLYPVWIPASGPCRLSRMLTSGRPDVPDARPSIARRRSTSLSTASPTSESVRGSLTGLRPSVRFPSPWRTRWPGRSRDRKFSHARR